MTKNNTHLFRCYMYKLLTSPAIYIAILGLAAFCLLSRTSFGTSLDSLKGCEVISLFNTMINIDAMRKTVVIFSAIPFAANFADEWKNSVTISTVVRCGVKRYTLCNMLCVFLSAVITVFWGLLLFVGTASIFSAEFCFPIEESEYIEKPFEFIFRNDLSFFYVVYKSFVLALSCGAWAVMGLAVSAFFPNKYVAVCSPLVVSYLLERLTFYLPGSIAVACVQNSDIQFDSLWGQLAYSSGYFAMLAAVGGVLFGIMVKRRVHNETV